MSLIWVAGAGELASAVGWRLVQSKYKVVMTEIASPMAVRRPICFSEAVYSGECNVEGVVGKLDSEITQGEVSVFVDPNGIRVRAMNVDAFVDARMTKKEMPRFVDDTVFAIGLGPGFICKKNCDFIIETDRAVRIGEVIKDGAATADTGKPGAVKGVSYNRLLRSPTDGKLIPIMQIGQMAEVNQVIGHVNGQPVCANTDGLIRGLVHENAELKAGVKVGDIDPRGEEVDPNKITDKGLAVAGGVLEALLSQSILPIR